MTRRSSRAWALGAVTVGFVACGGSSTLGHISATGDDDSGVETGGTSPTASKGGSSARSAGRAGASGARGGSAGSGGGKSRGDGGGKSSEAGTGGRRNDGGEAGALAGESGIGGGSGSGGSSGTGGQAGTATVDPSCQCTTHDHEFSCTTATVVVPEGFAAPSACVSGATAVKREICGTGFRYTFDEGGGSEYVLEVDGTIESTWSATYFTGTGDLAPGCGLDSQEFVHGTIARGEPNGIVCTNPCAQCGSIPGLEACEACERPNGPGEVWTPLSVYCASAYCPLTIAEAREHLLVECGSAAGGAHEFTGCGKVTFSTTLDPNTVEYIFDQQSGALESVYLASAADFGPCDAVVYQAGFRSYCGNATDCFYCRPGSGEAGAAGAPGAGGAADGIVCQ